MHSNPDKITVQHVLSPAGRAVHQIQNVLIDRLKCEWDNMCISANTQVIGEDENDERY